ncbi:MAG: peptidoglycan-binding domain-containing protein [Chthoniobacteraceae bacterium]|nr:peptidoglycan-binding domain-containing protein [Chthoniobacteraceae bacterium]
MDWRRGLIAVSAVAAALATAACGGRAGDKEALSQEGETPPVAAVQALLLRQRLYAGPVDGIPGEATTAAVRRYQIVHGMRATGRLDPRTLHTMLGPPPPLTGELLASDREILRELAETPLPDPVAERRVAIPALPPPVIATPSPTPRRGAASKAARTRSTKTHRSGSFSGPVE